VTAATSTRAREAVAAGRRLLEEEGTAALTMRRLAERLGIRAPSLYKHLPDKAALEAAIIATGLEEAAEAFEAAADGADEPLPALAAAYRGFALAHPHLYRLMNNGPLPRPAPANRPDRRLGMVRPVVRGSDGRDGGARCD
jgi:AcrR family transcriptional regulator